MTSTTTHTPDRAYFDAIAAQMPDWEHTSDWQLAYAGTESQYHGAYLYADYDRRAQKIAWSCNLHVRCGTEQYFILYALSYDERNRINMHANVSLTKCPAKVAQELQRRLLPHYLPLYAKGMERVAATLTQKQSDAALAAQLAAILGTTVRRRYNQDVQPPTVDVAGVASFTVEHGSIRFTHHPSFSGEQAVQLCQLFASWQQQR